MEAIEQRFNKFALGIKKIEEGCRLLSSGPANYYLQEVVGAYNYLVNRFSPFKVGDRVELAETPEIKECSGWWSSRHFLKTGEKCKIKEIECDSNGFRYFVEFDNESWIDRSNVEYKIKDKYVYPFREKYLRFTPKVICNMASECKYIHDCSHRGRHEENNGCKERECDSHPEARCIPCAGI